MKPQENKQSHIPFKTVLLYFWVHAKKYPWSFWSVFLFYMIASVLSSALVPFLYKEIIDVVSLGVIDTATQESLMAIVAKIALVFVAYNIFYRIGDFALGYSQSNILRDLTTEAYDKLTQHSYAFFSGNFGGSLVAKSKRYISSFESIHDIIVFNVWMSGVSLAATLFVLFSQHYVLGLILLVWVLIYILFTVHLAKKQISYDLEEASADSRITAQLSDVITNILNVKMFATRSQEQNEFKSIAQEEERARRRAVYFGNFVIAIQGFSVAILEVGGMYVAVQLWLEGKITAGTVVLVQIYFASVFQMVWALGKAITRLSKALSNASEMVEIMEEKPSVLDNLNPEVCTIEKGALTFNEVSFAYEDNDAVLTNFSLNIPDGQKIGLVGYSGSGKSTISKLLLRFANLSSGNILIDGQDISVLSQDDLRANIAYVPQEPLLFHRTLRENIAYGKPQATDAEVIEAAKRANAHEFISGFTQGYDTQVGERGVKLSGGERQRVAIARAILKNAPVLVLDEATSSLDSVSEKYIQAALEELMKGKTAIVIAHRLSTIQKMDRIIVLDKGTITQDGTHEELITKNGLYANLWKHQTGGFVE